MSDALQIAAWLAVLAGGLGAVVIAWRMGLPRTLARDALHVGAGVWVVGWPWWNDPRVAAVLPLLAAVGVLTVPRLSAAWAPARALRSAVSDGEERWSGIVLYVVSFAVLTIAAALGDPMPAAAALWALCLGDGLGGLVGRHLGRLRYRVPGAKGKSVEGSLTVAAGGFVAVLLAGAWFGAPVGIGLAVVAGVAAAVAEALAPRALDNLLVPAVVYAVVQFGGG